jgi:hypothetical protein
MAYLGKVSSDRNIARRITTSLTPSSTTFLRCSLSLPSPLSLRTYFSLLVLPFFLSFLFLFSPPYASPLRMHSPPTSEPFLHNVRTFTVEPSLELYCEPRTKKNTHHRHHARRPRWPPISTRSPRHHGKPIPKLRTWRLHDLWLPIIQTSFTSWLINSPLLSSRYTTPSLRSRPPTSTPSPPAP